MRKPIMHGIKPFPQVIFTSILVISVGLVFQLFAILTAIPLFGVGISEAFALDVAGNPVHLAALKYIQILGALGTFVFSSFLLSFLYTGSWFDYFSFGKSHRVHMFIIPAIIMIAGLPFVNYLTELNANMHIPGERIEHFFRTMEDETEALMMQLVSAKTIPGLLVNLFMIAVIPAVGEELVFRGLLQRHFTEWFRNQHLAVIVTAAVFSIVHFQVFSFLPRFFLGLVLGYLLVYGKSLWYPMIGHFVNNALGVIFYYFYLNNNGGEALEDIGTNHMMPAFAAYSFLIVVLLMLGWRQLNRIAQSS